MARPEIKEVGSYCDRSIITDNMTDAETTEFLKNLYNSNKSTIEGMYAKVKDKQHLQVLFYPNGLIIIGIVANGESLRKSEHLTGAAIPKGESLDEWILYGIEERVYRTVKELNQAIAETKEYEKRLRA